MANDDNKQNKFVKALNGSTVDALNTAIETLALEYGNFKIKEIQYQAFQGSYSALISFEGKLIEDEE
jgi:hypothetical protein